jgi:hypothetical protein
MKVLRFILWTLASGGVAFGGITYTCASNVDATTAGTCAYLNSTVAGLYGVFSNINANIYIQMGTTGLGENFGAYNSVSYSTYLTDLTANSVASGNPVQVSAAHNVEITSALGSALGIPNSSLTGVTSGGGGCTIGTMGCYNGVITVTTPANLATEEPGQGLYWNQQGGTQPAEDYDFYSVVEHETDEVLGTASCITTTTNPISDSCNFMGAGTPSAVDLFRYSAAGQLILNNSLSTTPGAYFSYNGGFANGVPNGSVYNTLDNMQDYADFAENCMNVQDATGCLGQDLNINTDGGGEINILNAVGFDLVTTPEPTTFALLGASLATLAFARSKRRKQ